jgi:putative AlgH/UPF0301 family transcriptional regulator
VASNSSPGSIYEQTVILAAPLPQGRYVGFIVNRPTSVKLETLFPEPNRRPQRRRPGIRRRSLLSRAVFAVMRKAPDNSADFVSLMPGLVAAVDGSTVDRVIEKSPNDARYFVGLMLWAPEELDDEIDNGAWEVRPWMRIRCCVPTLPASGNCWKVRWS